MSAAGSTATAARPSDHAAIADAAGLLQWWPLAALLALGAVLRFATIDLQSLWYDEAFTPVHVLHPGLAATLHSVVHTENTPPLYYILLWAWTRAFGTGAIALRSLSAVAGVGMIGAAWGIGLELGARRIAIALAALVAVNPLFVWYSQEARAYILLALFASLAYMYFERARRRPSARALALWALFSILALTSHYFAVFLIAPQAALLLWRARLRRGELFASAAVAAAGAALVPLIVSQGGHGTQWIGHWKLTSRLIAIPQYYVLGESGSPLGHGLLLAACVLVAACVLLWPRLTREEQDRALVAGGLGVAAIAVPLLLALAGVDYLAPRNLIAAFVPISAAVAVLVGARRSGQAGVALAATICVAWLAVVLDVDASPRLQRGDWHGLANALPVAPAPPGARLSPAGPTARVIVTPELGSAPLEYYEPGLTRLATGAIVTASEIDLVGYSPIRAGAARPPVSGARLIARRSVHGLVAYVFRSSVYRDGAVTVSERALRAKRLVATRTQVLVLNRRSP